MGSPPPTTSSRSTHVQHPHDSPAPHSVTTALVAFAIAGASTATVTHVQADLPALQVSSNLHCGTLTIGVTMFNNTATDTVGNVVLQSSLQNSSSTATVPANGVVDVSFPVAIGERLDKLILRDSNLTVVHTIFYDQVITGTGDCVRPSFDLVQMTGYSLTCANGVTQATVTIENNGDYPAEMYAQGSAWLPTEAEYADALQQGLITADSEATTLAAGDDWVVELMFKVIDAMVVHVDNGQSSVFTDGPRTPVAGEGCTPSIPEETVPEETVPTTAAPQPTVPETAAPEIPVVTTVPVTTVAAPASATPTTPATSDSTVPAADQEARTLPSTGRSSLPFGLVGSLLFTAGLGLVRITRRRQA